MVLRQGSNPRQPAPHQGAVASATPAHVVIPPMLLALYSILTMYCIRIALYGVYVLHDVLGKGWEPLYRTMSPRPGLLEH